MALNLTKLEATRVTAALAGADFEEKNPQEVGKSLGTEEHTQVCQGMAQDFNYSLSKWCWGWGEQPKGGSVGLCVLSAPGSAPSQCPVLPSECRSTQQIQNMTCFLHAKASCLFFPQNCCISGACRHPVSLPPAHMKPWVCYEHYKGEKPSGMIK